PDAGIDNTGFYVRKDEREDPGLMQIQDTGRAIFHMAVVLHRSRWMQLGYDVNTPELAGQNVGTETYQTKYDISFRELEAGTQYSIFGTHDTGEIVPTSGYYEANFHTAALDGSDKNGYEDTWANYGHRRYYEPKYEGGAFEIT